MQGVHTEKERWLSMAKSKTHTINDLTGINHYDKVLDCFVMNDGSYIDILKIRGHDLLNTDQDQVTYECCVLLKWIKEDRVSINKEEKNGIISKQKSSIIFKDKNEFDEKLESDLYNMLYEASKDGILESKEFEKWSKKHYSKILNWFGKVLDKEAAKLILENNLVKNEKKILFIKYEDYTLNDSLKEEAKQLQGLKKFLMEFTNIKEREDIEVKLYAEISTKMKVVVCEE